MDELTHVDSDGKASMVDVGGKPPQQRMARAAGRIRLAPETIRLVKQNRMKKGDVLTVAKIAGIQAAKQTAHLIPLCHPLIISTVQLDAAVEADSIEITSEVHCIGPTGVEMEALTAVSVALLTIYDMCKAVDQSMRIDEVRLLEKTKDNVA